MPTIRQTFGSYEALLGRLNRDSVRTWSDIEADFLAATSLFDAEYSKGQRSKGWYQAKARYFNDILVALLANASGKQITTRRKKKSQLFGTLDIDICYPEGDPPTIGAEVKALGTPPYPGNKMHGRPATRDLHKRIREVALTAIDFKAAYAPPKPIGSFQNWIDSSPPGYFAFWAMRVEDQADFEKMRTMLVNLRAYCNGVGAVVFMGNSPDRPTDYEICSVRELDMDRVIREIAQRIT